ncbi:siderophore-interacting protein [Parahaliea maris]|uniref:Siderophore-interacting protein n=1 Tax=Parahaliea maris TaxID=2716870 RepID=A0A5C9A539_9GAMM|nr:siderophore-interacting protein [Parahaliea maris]TXS95189.1 siderophore-interacting protein [Parahaliea maris]
MPRPTPRTLEVIDTEQLTPHMRRVTLGGSGIDDFPTDQESAYIKLMFPRPGQAPPLMRTYTVSRQRRDAIDVDFALHEAAGPASRWAVEARPGDRILVGGPGPKKLINTAADWYLLAGDMTALPAIAVNLQLLPDNARGYVVIEVVDAEDQRPLVAPQGMEVIWVSNPAAGSEETGLAQRVRNLPWLAGQAAVWAACEFQDMRELRRYLKQERGVAKSHLYVSSYWKRGSTEDQHKVAKQADAREDEGNPA